MNLVLHILGLAVGIGLAYLLADSIDFKSKSIGLILAIFIPISIWILVSFIYVPILYSDYVPSGIKNLDLTFADKITSASGTALGQFLLGYIGFGVTFYRRYKKKKG